MFKPMSNAYLNPLSKNIQAGSRLACTNASGTERAFITAEIARTISRPICMVLPTRKACDRMAADIQFFLGADSREVFVFPPYNILPFKQIAYHNETAAKRIHLLYRLASGNAASMIILLPAETLLQRLIPKSILNDYAELLMAGEEIDRDSLITHLHAGGYNHTALVEEPGEYAVRGGIIDIFSPMYAEPLRMELFGDVVDDLRFFSPGTQRKTGTAEEAVILPAREAVLKKQWLDEMIQRVRDHGPDLGLSGNRLTGLSAAFAQKGCLTDWKVSCRSCIQGLIRFLRMYRKMPYGFKVMPGRLKKQPLMRKMWLPETICRQKRKIVCVWTLTIFMTAGPRWHQT